MREIKFRVWDKNKKMIRNVISFHFLEGEEGVEAWGKSYKDFETGEQSCDRDFIKLEDVDLMQYTGLKDSKGVEIYEGDIIESKEGGVRFKVDFGWNTDLDAFGIIYISLRPPFKSYSSDGAEKLKVIGNIYQNPELLK